MIIIGGGGHAAVLLDMLLKQQREIVGVVSPGERPVRKVFDNIPHFTTDTEVLKFNKNSIKLVNGIGSLPGGSLRTSLYNKFTNLGYEFETVIADNSIVSTYAELASGVQVMSGAIIQTGVNVGSNSIINTGAIVDHDCKIGINNHVASGVTISGQVESQENVHFGTGAAVIHSVNIGANVVIGAGSTICKDILENTICYPARITKKDLNINES